MTKFAVFAYHEYEAQGGWTDLISVEVDFFDAYNKLKDNMAQSMDGDNPWGYDDGHIVNLETLEMYDWEEGVLL